MYGRAARLEFTDGELTAVTRRPPGGRRLSALLARRTAAALRAVSGGGTVYLENGNRVV